MRESIGGAFLFNLVLIFLGVYVAVLCFAIVYARAFNSKNHIITLIEQNEGLSNAKDEINNYMASRSSGVNVDRNLCCQLYTEKYMDPSCGSNVTEIQGGCIFERSAKKITTGTNMNAKTYVVTTFMSVDIPVVRAFTRLLPISGETKVIYERAKAN